MLANYEDWSNATKGVESRVLLVHGAAWSGLVSANQLLGAPYAPDLMAQFGKFLGDYCRASSGKNAEVVNVNAVILDMVTMFNVGVFGYSVADWRRFFHAIETPLEHAPYPPGVDPTNDEHGEFRQRNWKSVVFYMEPRAVLDVMKQHYRQQGKSMPLEYSDLRDQMSNKPWWHPKNNVRGASRCRFNGASVTSWMFIVDKMGELGYQYVPDDEYYKSKFKQPGQAGLTGVMMPDAEWADPRKGPIFAIIDKLLAKSGHGEGGEP